MGRFRVQCLSRVLLVRASGIKGFVGLLGLGVWGSRVQGSGIYGLELGAESVVGLQGCGVVGFRAQGLGLGFRVWGLGFGFRA